MKRFLGVLLAGAIMGTMPSVAQGAPPLGVTGMAQDGRVELSWQAAAGATSYNVYRGTSPTAINTPVSLTGVPPPPLSAPASFGDGTAANGTTYYYAVRAVVGGVESANSRVVRATPRPRSCSGGNPVVQENCFPGDSDWDVAIASTGVAGYATSQSVNRGQSIDLKVQSGAAVDIEIFRSGHYGGAGARLFSTLVDVPVSAQPGCSNDPAVGLYDCSAWSVTQTITTTAGWPSGVYLARVTRRDTGDDTHVLFVVRDDSRHAEVLFGLPFTTYQAYNNFGGKSLYESKSTGPDTVAGSPRAVKVSFDRPYLQQHDSIQHDWYTRTDYATVAWLERSGYDVSYESVSDMERSPGRVLDHRVFISGAHDEYYSATMRDCARAGARARRGPALHGRERRLLEDPLRAEPGLGPAGPRARLLQDARRAAPADPSGIATGTWRDPAGANRPENALTGGQYVGEKHFDWFPLRVSAAQGRDRIWRNTGLENQANGTFTNVGNDLVGWEWDARVNNGLEPAGVTTLAESPVDGRHPAGRRPHLRRERHGARARHQVHVAERLARVRRGHQPLELGPRARTRAARASPTAASSRPPPTSWPTWARCRRLRRPTSCSTIPTRRRS